jgi:hypothetical protein
MGWLNDALEGALPGIQFLTAGLGLYLAYEAYKRKPKSNKEQIQIDARFRADRNTANAYHHLGLVRSEDRTPNPTEAH